MQKFTVARAAIAIALAVVVVLLGTLAMPRPPSLATNVTGDPQLAARARPLLTGAIDKVSVASIDGDKVTYAHFGASETTQYEIGSITKTFTSLLLADAITRGEVKADTKIGELLPLDGAAVADVTLAELASHRSGLPRLATRPQDIFGSAFRSILHKDPYTQDVAGVIAQARSAELTNRGQFLYSNLGAALLGQALAAVTKMDYAQLVQERIFKPLGMTASIVPVSAANLPDNAPTGYSAGGQNEAPWTLNGSAPAGGIRSTPADMVRYAQALLAGTAPGIEALTPQWDAGTQRIGLAWLPEDRGRGVEGRRFRCARQLDRVEVADPAPHADQPRQEERPVALALDLPWCLAALGHADDGADDRAERQPDHIGRDQVDVGHCHARQGRRARRAEGRGEGQADADPMVGRERFVLGQFRFERAAWQGDQHHPGDHQQCANNGLWPDLLTEERRRDDQCEERVARRDRHRESDPQALDRGELQDVADHHTQQDGEQQHPQRPCRDREEVGRLPQGEEDDREAERREGVAPGIRRGPAEFHDLTA